MAPETIELARQQLHFAREYTNQLFADIQPEEWFACPPGAPSHLAWQMGHLAMAEYFLAIARIRDRDPEDASFISKAFLRSFQKGSQPTSDPGGYPPLAEIRQVFDEVHRRALEAIAGYSVTQLAAPLPAPYAVYPNKLGSLFFSSHHEMLHAGQIGMLRRMLGKAPLR